MSYLREYLKYMIFNILSMLAVSFYIVVDTLFISARMGSSGLAALNLAIPIFNLQSGIGLMLGMGGAILYTIAGSRADTERQNTIFTLTCLMGAGFALVLFLMGLFLPGKISTLLGADALTFDMTCVYIRVTLLFAPAFIAANVTNAFVRNDGGPRLAAFGTALGSIANVLFDYIFMYPLGMGMFGAVLATGFAPVFNLCVLSLHFLRKKNNFHLIGTGVRPRLMLKVLRLGLPSLINELSTGIVIVAFNLLILGIQGNTGIAAYGIITNLSLVVTYIFAGIAQGTQPLTSKLYGEHNPRGVRTVLIYAWISILLVSSLVIASAILAAPQLTSLFNLSHEAELQAISEHGMKLYFLCAPFTGFNMVMAVYFASVEDALPAQLISLLRGLFLIIPMAIILSAVLGMDGIWLTLMVTDLIVAGYAAVAYIRSGKKQMAQRAM